MVLVLIVVISMLEAKGIIDIDYSLSFVISCLLHFAAEVSSIPIVDDSGSLYDVYSRR